MNKATLNLIASFSMCAVLMLLMFILAACAEKDPLQELFSNSGQWQPINKAEEIPNE